MFEAPAAGTYTFYLNGYGVESNALIFPPPPAVAVPYYSFGMSASVIFLPDTLTVTSASGGASLSVDQLES